MSLNEHAPFGASRGFERALALPIGLASPLWLAFGAAASASTAWWWMTRWTGVGRLTPASPPVVAPEPPPAPIALAAPIETRPDELTLLKGVGPRIADALVARGVTRFADLAAWTEEDLATFDAALNLMGRTKRYDFIGQARTLVDADHAS